MVSPWFWVASSRFFVSSWFWVFFSHRSRHTDNCHPFHPDNFHLSSFDSRPTQDQGICTRRLSRRWACLQACCFPDSTGSDGEKKKQARLFIRVQLRLCTVACFLCLACMLCAPLPSTMLPATRHPKNKEVHSCRARPFAMQRTSTENIARVLGLDTKPQGDRNSSSHCRACPSSSEDVRPPRSLAMQLHPLQLRRPPRGVHRQLALAWELRLHHLLHPRRGSPPPRPRHCISDIINSSKEPQRGHSHSKPPAPLAVLQSWCP